MSHYHLVHYCREFDIQGITNEPPTLSAADGWRKPLGSTKTHSYKVPCVKLVHTITMYGVPERSKQPGRWLTYFARDQRCQRKAVEGE